MTNQLTPSGAPMHFSARLARDIVACFNKSARSKKRNPDEGALLVEVLVGMLILVIVFTATTISLSSMAQRRVQIEQRDRALALASSYDELSRTFKCGFVVDRIENSLSTFSTANPGFDEFVTKVRNCDFRVKDGHLPGYSTPRNAGDQTFIKREPLNRSGTSFQDFEIKIRYWFEEAGTADHTRICTSISNVDQLPVILTRAISVSWNENSAERKISIIKRDPVPSDNVVFASGNRVNLVVNRPSSITSDNLGWETRLIPYPANTNLYIAKVTDPSPTDEPRIAGQPPLCHWYPYITPDSSADRKLSRFNQSGGLIDGPSDIEIKYSSTLGPQGFKPVAP